MTFVLRRDTTVGRDNGRIEVIPGGTKMSDIDKADLAQLAPEHFKDDGGGDKLPKDWRTDEATLEHDRRQNEANEREARERVERKAAFNVARNGE
jgi:hypothetical protein